MRGFKNAACVIFAVIGFMHSGSLELIFIVSSRRLAKPLLHLLVGQLDISREHALVALAPVLQNKVRILVLDCLKRLSCILVLQEAQK